MPSNFSHLKLRTARVSDVPAIVGLFAEDVLGQTRESASVPGDSYHQAFAAIEDRVSAHGYLSRYLCVLKREAAN